MFKAVLQERMRGQLHKGRETKEGLAEEVTFELSIEDKSGWPGRRGEANRKQYKYGHDNVIAQKAGASGKGSCGFRWNEICTIRCCQVEMAG